MDNSLSGTWLPPDVIDEFRLLRPLGQGAMGQVYLGQDTLLDRQVAVKFISAFHPDERSRQRFLTEARAVARLQHPNVVTIYRVGEIDGHPFLVSELVHGVSLSEMVKPVAWSQVLTMAIDGARGLAAAHRQGVLHRDIKPANMMLTTDGQVKLLDFGLATISDAGAPGQSGLSTFEVEGAVGTPLYMAPEVRRGQPATRRSDVYSLGCALFELSAGRAPLQVALGALDSFTGTDDTNDATQAESLDAGDLDAEVPRPPPLRRLVRDIDRAFASIVDRCLEIDPELRFASGEELWDALVGLRAAVPAGRIPAGNPYRGLLPFDEDHRALFFGRGPEIRVVLERLRTEPLLILAGGSGTGKTSLCRAGVLPLCAEGALGTGQRWTVVKTTPGQRPLRALAASLAPLLAQQEDDLVALLSAEPQALAQALRHRDRDTGVVLFIDQIEELFTLAPAGEAGPYGELLAAFDLPCPTVRVLLAIRADFLPRLLSLPGIGTVVARALHLLRPLDAEGVREAVVGPARSSGVRFESEALVNTLVAAARETGGGLSLVQFALAELWQARDAAIPVITEASLEALGGVTGALARRADGVLSLLDEAGRNQARRLFSALVDRDNQRLQRTRADLCPDAASGAVLEALVRGRLVVATETAGETAYEIAHDALLQQWTTLREWLDHSAESRLARRRIEVAAAEWERLGRPREALWQERQIRDVSQVHEADLWPREAAFLLASRHALRRRRRLRQVVLFSVPMLLGLGYGGLKLAAQQALNRSVASRVAKAMPARQLGQRAQQEGLVQRAEALLAFARGDTEAEDVWAKAQTLLGQADDAYATASQELEAALILDPRRGSMRRLLSEVTVARVLLLEEMHRIRDRDELLRRLPTYDETGEWQRFLRAPATIDIDSQPTGAEVVLYAATDRTFRLERTLGRTPLRGVVVPPGSWLLAFGAPLPSEQARLPLLLSRGEQRSLSVYLPPAGQVPAGYVYVPAGDFLFGSADDEALRQGFLHEQPLHRAHTAAYLIGRTEVTFGEWLAFLRELPAAERLRHLPGGANMESNLRLEELPGGTYRLRFKPLSVGHTAVEGEPIRYPERTRRKEQDWRRMPVSAISGQDAQAYLAWLDRTGRLRGARLCDELEWVRAARGADDRHFPHGDRLLPDDANFDETYGRNPLGLGPDEVGSHPLSQSPFGLQDMVGNVLELTRQPGDERHLVMRGGGWYYDQITNWISNRNIRDASSIRDISLGLRVCASLPEHQSSPSMR